MRKETEILEFKKSTGELKEAMISLSAMLNKHGKGKVIFDISPKGKIVKNQISESTLRDISRRIYEAIEPRIYPVIEIVVIDGVEVIEVNVEGNEQPYSAFGKYYIRTADEDRDLGSNELKEIIANLTYTGSWESQLTDFNLNDVDEKALKQFFNEAIKHGRLPESEYNPKNILTRLGLYTKNKLTNAGNVMFSKRGPVTLKMAIFATDEKLTFLDDATAHDNIYNLINITQTYIEKNIRWAAEIVDFKRVEVPEIPIEALREIVVNSFAHAQYNKDTYHEVRIHPSKIAIYSPGKFKSIYSPKEYIDSNFPSSIRNNLITKTLYLAKVIEQFGSGFKRVNSLCEDFNIVFEYKMHEEGFDFIFNRNLEKLTYTNKNIKFQTNISEQAKIVYDYLTSNPHYTREDLSQLMSKSVSSIQRYLNELSKNNYIERVGSDKTGHWKINN